MKLTRREFAAAVAGGIAAPYVISSARAQGVTIKTVRKRRERFTTTG